MAHIWSCFLRVVAGADGMRFSHRRRRSLSSERRIRDAQLQFRAVAVDLLPSMAIGEVNAG